jgi:hypothetical protein
MQMRLKNIFNMLSRKDIKVYGVNIDEAIKAAIAKAVSRHGSQTAIARQMGSAVSVVGQYMGTIKGRPTKTIPHAAYERLYPLIRAYLPSGDARYLPLSMRGEGDQESAGYTEAEQRMIQNYRELDPDQQHDFYAAIRAAAQTVKAKDAPPRETVLAS